MSFYMYIIFTTNSKKISKKFNCKQFNFNRRMINIQQPISSNIDNNEKFILFLNHFYLLDRRHLTFAYFHLIFISMDHHTYNQFNYVCRSLRQCDTENNNIADNEQISAKQKIKISLSRTKSKNMPNRILGYCLSEFIQYLME